MKRKTVSAAAGKPYKKRLHGSTKRSFVRTMVRAKPTVNLFSAMLPHYFRRSLADGVFSCSASGVVDVRDPTGALPPWLTFGTVAADYGGVATVSQFAFNVTPALIQLPSYQEFTNLFQRYQILKCTVKITPIMGDSFNAGAGSPLPYISSCLDYLDNTVVASQAGIDQYENKQEFLLDNQSNWSRSCVPKVAQSVYVSAVNTGYSSTGALGDNWLSTSASTNAAPHYGHKFYVRNFWSGGAGSGVGFRVQPILEFRLREAH